MIRLTLIAAQPETRPARGALAVATAKVKTAVKALTMGGRGALAFAMGGRGALAAATVCEARGEHKT